MRLPSEFIGHVNGYFLRERLLKTASCLVFSARISGTFQDCVVCLVSASGSGVSMDRAQDQLRSWHAVFERSPYSGRVRLLLPAAIESISLGADLELPEADRRDAAIGSSDYLLVYPGTDALRFVTRPGLEAGDPTEALSALRCIGSFSRYAVGADVPFHGPERGGISACSEDIFLSDPLLFPLAGSASGSAEAPGSVAFSNEAERSPEEARRALAVLLLDCIGDTRGRPLADVQGLSQSGIRDLCDGFSHSQADLVARALRTSLPAEELDSWGFPRQLQVLEALSRAGEAPDSRGHGWQVAAALVAVSVCVAGAVFYALGQVLG